MIDRIGAEFVNYDGAQIQATTVVTLLIQCDRLRVCVGEREGGVMVGL